MFFVRSGLRFAAALGFGVELYGLLISFRWLVAQNVVDSHDANCLLHMIRSVTVLLQNLAPAIFWMLGSLVETSADDAHDSPLVDACKKNTLLLCLMMLVVSSGLCWLFALAKHVCQAAFGRCQRSPDNAHALDLGVVSMMLCHPSDEHDASMMLVAWAHGCAPWLCSLLFCCATPRPADAHDAWLVGFSVVACFQCVCYLGGCLQKHNPADARDVCVLSAFLLALYATTRHTIVAFGGCVQDQPLLMRVMLGICRSVSLLRQKHAPVRLMMFKRLVFCLSTPMLLMILAFCSSVGCANESPMMFGVVCHPSREHDAVVWARGFTPCCFCPADAHDAWQVGFLVVDGFRRALAGLGEDNTPMSYAHDVSRILLFPSYLHHRTTCDDCGFWVLHAEQIPF